MLNKPLTLDKCFLLLHDLSINPPFVFHALKQFLPSNQHTLFILLRNSVWKLNVVPQTLDTISLYSSSLGNADAGTPTAGVGSSKYYSQSVAYIPPVPTTATPEMPSITTTQFWIQKMLNTSDNLALYSLNSQLFINNLSTVLYQPFTLKSFLLIAPDYMKDDRLHPVTNVDVVLNFWDFHIGNFQYYNANALTPLRILKPQKVEVIPTGDLYMPYYQGILLQLIKMPNAYVKFYNQYGDRVDVKTSSAVTTPCHLLVIALPLIDGIIKSSHSWDRQNGVRFILLDVYSVNGISQFDKPLKDRLAAASAIRHPQISLACVHYTNPAKIVAKATRLAKTSMYPYITGIIATPDGPILRHGKISLHRQSFYKFINTSYYDITNNTIVKTSGEVSLSKYTVGKIVTRYVEYTLFYAQHNTTIYSARFNPDLLRFEHYATHTWHKPLRFNTHPITIAGNKIAVCGWCIGKLHYNTPMSDNGVLHTLNITFSPAYSYKDL